MKIHRFFIGVIVCSLVISVQFSNAEPISSTGRIREVTVYRGQAMVTRVMEIDLTAGNNEIVVTGLPHNILSESLFARAEAGVKILSVRYQERAVREDTRDEIRVIDARLEEILVEMGHLEKHLQRVMAQWELLQKFNEFMVVRARQDLEQSVMQFEPVSQLIDLFEERSQAYTEQELELKDSIAQLKKEQELQNRKRNELSGGRSQTVREATVYLNSAKQQKAPIELSYLVQGATWEPQYNLRAQPGQAHVQVEYNAIINQGSGEDWNGVAITLSTAQPSMVASAPVLDPMEVILAGTNANMMEKMQQEVQMMGTQQRGMNVPMVPQMAQSQSGRMDDKSLVQFMNQYRRSQAIAGKKAEGILNDLARNNQTIEFNFDNRLIQEYQQQAEEATRTESVSVSYQLPGELSLPSRNDQQLVSIATVECQADFTLLASPLLTDYVYLQGDLVNTSETVLLPGPASMYRNGEFAGKGQLPLVTINESFTAGFGIDSQVQVSRELADKQTRIQGGNKIDTYRYRIELSNYKKVPVAVRLLDRLPYSTNSSIKIELVKTSPELSQNKDYRRLEYKKGILRWDMELAPGTTGEKATVANYELMMEYDRNMQMVPKE